MQHFVTFRDQDNHWDNGLPLGNGVFGTMVYFEYGKLYMPLNHYEVYSTKLYSRPCDTEEHLKNNPPPADYDYGKSHRAYLEMAKNNTPPAGEPYSSYRRPREETKNEATGFFSSSLPSTGDLSFTFDDSLRESGHTLTLDVEKAFVSMDYAGQVQMEVRSLRPDCILTQVTQASAGLVKSVRIAMDPARDRAEPEVLWAQESPEVFSWTVTRALSSEKDFVFSGILRLVGTQGHLEGDTLVLSGDSRDFTLITGIFTQWNYADPRAEGIELTRIWADTIPDLCREHREYWDTFFSRSSLDLPDKFLEHVYYVNQYALDCCSGKDGIMKHNACGLNGLWDVRRPVLWASVWYWDVNIQASFAGVFTANRLDLGKVFSDGLRTYIGVAEDYARRVHNLPGVALDYPYQNYYCVWPWCAQYLWYQYEYSLDQDYLRQDAYPLFLKLCEFAVGIFVYNSRTDTYDVPADISPEQGPLGTNTTITISSIKYMFQFTLEAAKILGDDAPILADVRRILAKMPPYHFSGPSAYGSHLKDSQDAPDEMGVRHPSLLMPIYPIGELDPFSCDEELRQKLSNTVDFLFDNTEIGIFGGSWIAAAAARLGRGNLALRTLYERGIDHMLRSNALTAEATDRFMNFCLVCRQPLYYPCMMEFTGEMLAAVHEMLLQSYNGLIRLFPAIPDGKIDWSEYLRNGYRYGEHYHRNGEYPAWTDVRFDKLLTKGAFEISAALKDSRLIWLKIRSQKGGTLRLTSPFLTEAPQIFCDGCLVPVSFENGVLSFETVPGGVYCAGQEPEREEKAAVPAVLAHKSYTKRRIFIGEDPDSAYCTALDQFTRDWYLGNLRFHNHTVYKFDLGVAHNEKDYLNTFSRQAYIDHMRTLLNLDFRPIGEENAAFTVMQGFGFSNTAGITACAREMDDCLRRDFLQGEAETDFVIDLPRGQYELLVVSGDQEGECVTCLETANGFRTGGEVVKAGRYQCALVPVIHERDTELRLHISTKPGYRWKINCIYLNSVKGYF